MTGLESDKVALFEGWKRAYISSKGLRLVEGEGLSTEGPCWLDSTAILVSPAVACSIFTVP